MCEWAWVGAMRSQAVAGAMHAAPGSFWTHSAAGRERAGLLSTLRKAANQAAAELEGSVAAAAQLEKRMLQQAAEQQQRRAAQVCACVWSDRSSQSRRW